MEISGHSEKSTAELLGQDSYTPEELATLMDVNVNVIRNACYEGRLKAEIVNHDIISIKRSDALEWMSSR